MNVKFKQNLNQAQYNKSDNLQNQQQGKPLNGSIGKHISEANQASTSKADIDWKNKCDALEMARKTLKGNNSKLAKDLKNVKQVCTELKEQLEQTELIKHKLEKKSIHDEGKILYLSGELENKKKETNNLLSHILDQNSKIGGLTTRIAQLLGSQKFPKKDEAASVIEETNKALEKEVAEKSKLIIELEQKVFLLKKEKENKESEYMEKFISQNSTIKTLEKEVEELKIINQKLQHELEEEKTRANTDLLDIVNFEAISSDKNIEDHSNNINKQESEEWTEVTESTNV